MSDDWPSAGTLLATRYRLVALLETGGMAQIWRARDEALDRPVAIKLPKGPQVVWREARMAAKLSHPNIAAVHDYREAVRTDGTVTPFVVMELLAGETVAARLVRETFGWQEAARVGAAVADALAAAHSGGVIHRDIKPGNVMLTPTGVKILDFGISATAGEPDDDDTGATFGTPAYVAPERLDGMSAQPATDVYGLGVLLFEMVTGQPPYPVETWEELDEARQHGPDTLPSSLPADFRAVVDRCLSEDQADRPQAAEVRFTLTALWLAADQSTTGDQPASSIQDAASQAAASQAAARGATSQDAASQAATRGATSQDAAAGQTAVAASGAQPTSPAPGSARPGGGRPGNARPADARPSGAPAGGARPGDRRAGSESVAGDQRQFATGASPVRRPRAAELWSSGPGVTGTGREASAPASGRVTPATLEMTPPPPKRRLALVLAVLALLAAAGGIYAVVNRPGEKAEAHQPSTTHPATRFYSSSGPAAEAPTVKPTTAPASSPAPSPTPKLTFEDAMSRLRTAVEDGAAGGEIRGDVATDLLNLIRNLERADTKDVDTQVSQLRRKITERTGEGGLSAKRAAILRARVTDLERAAGM